MIRSTLRRLLCGPRGSGDADRDRELLALRAEVEALRAELGQLRAARSAAPRQVASFAEAAQALSAGVDVRLEQPADAPGSSTDRATAAGPPRLLVIDQQDCIACGTCVEYSDQAFRLGDDGRAFVASQDAPRELVQEAIDACPTSCIHWG